MKERVVEAQRLADDVASKFAKPFFIAGQTESGAGKSARLDLAIQQVTGDVIRIDPQLLGDCVAAAMDRTLAMKTCAAILKDAFEEYAWLFSPFHYATGRVLVGKNQLRGGDGSVGGWQAEAVATYGFISEIAAGIEYTKALGKAWGDDKKYQGKSFRDFLELAKAQKVLQWARTNGWNETRDSLYHGYPLHICANTGYTMKPNSSGYHMPSGSWPHAMTVYAFWENIKVPLVAILNSWGDVHGRVKDPITGELLPPGTLLVPIEEFVKRHLMRGAECISISSVDGFDAKIDWARLGGKKTQAA
jgi:hypothetical protein